MIELELLLKDLAKLYEKEKGMRNRILIEGAISHLKQYEQAVTAPEPMLASSKE